MANGSLGSQTGSSSFIPSDSSATPLQQALESLSVNLEDELLRYRQSHSKNGAAQPYSKQLKFRPGKRRRQGLNLIQVQARSSDRSQTSPAPAQPSAAAMGQGLSPTVQPSTATATGTQTVPPPPANPRLQQPLAKVSLPQAQTYSPQAATPTTGYALQRRGGSLTPYQQLPDDYLESTEALLDSLPSAYDSHDGYDDVEYEPSLREQLATPLGIGALLLLLVGSAGFGYLITSPKTAEFLRENALVQTLRGQAPEPEAEPQVEAVAPPANDPETGLQGIGPDLSEDEFKELDLGRLSTLEEEEAAPSRTRNPLESASPSLDRDPAEAAAGSPSPSRGAVDLPIRTAPRSATPAPTATATPAAPTAVTRPQVPATPTQPQVRAAAPQQTVTPVPQVIQAPQPAAQTPPQPVVRSAPPAAPAAPPQPLATNPAPQPLPQPQTAPPAPLSQTSSAPTSGTAPAPITAPPPQPTSSYYVVTDYTGDQSLQSARSAVGGAYVRNFPNGARIQMGAFSQESAARNLVQQLQGQGIPARVYSP